MNDYKKVKTPSGRSFPFATMQIGESFDVLIDAQKIRSSAKSFARYAKGFSVSVETLPDFQGSRVTRLS